MPLKSLDQISSLAKYKKLVQADAAALKATAGTKFQAFSKFTFADKTSSPAIFFNVTDATLLAALTKAGTGPASGVATVNAADEIVLNVAKGNVVNASMGQALKSCGVARNLAADQPVPDQTDPSTTLPQFNTATKPNTPQPTKTVLGNSRGATTTTGPQKPTTPPPPSPNTKPQQTAPKTVTPPPQGMPQVPPRPVPNTPEKLFKARLASVKGKMTTVQLPPEANQAYQSALNKAKTSDFAGALQDIAIIDGAIGKATFNQARDQKMTNRKARLDETFNAVKKSYFTPGSSDRIAKEDLSAGTHFKAFLKAQKAFEGARDEATLNTLETTAQAFCDHYVKEKRKGDKKADRKNFICTEALKMARHFRLTFEQDKLNDPNSGISLDEKEIRSAELYTKLMFEQDDAKLASPLKKSGVNGSFWIEKTVWGDKPTENEQAKTFIFKPMDKEEPIAGFPNGGSAARELLGKAIGDQLQSSMGIDFNLPETTVVKVNSSKVPGDDGNPGSENETRIGSIQHFAKSRGELKDVLKNDPDFIKKVPPEDTHKLAVLDFVQLNMDRHDGNFMVGETDGANGKAPKLIPIDHGLTFPSREGLRQRGDRLAPDKSAISLLPGADTKMGPELVEKIKQMNPDDVVAGLKKTHQALRKLQPEAENAANITDENFELSKRSIQFLQKACTELTVQELQLAYSSSQDDIFDTDPKDPTAMQKGFADAIKSAKDRMPHVKEINALVAKDRDTFDQTMSDLGWFTASAASFYMWMNKNPKAALDAFKTKTPNPKVMKEIADLKEELKDLPANELKSPQNGVLKELEHLRAKKEQRTVNALLTKRNLPPDSVKSTPDRAKFLQRNAIYDEFGGDGAVNQLDPNAANQGFDAKVDLLLGSKYASLGGDTAYEKVLALYPRSTTFKTPAGRVRLLKDYEAYNQLGGDKEYYKRGGAPEVDTLSGRIRDLTSMLELDSLVQAKQQGS